MSYGRLDVIKLIGEKPTFCIRDENNNITIAVPDFTDWMMRRIGTTISLFISDAYFQVTDEEKK